VVAFSSKKLVVIITSTVKISPVYGHSPSKHWLASYRLSFLCPPHVLNFCILCVFGQAKNFLFSLISCFPFWLTPISIVVHCLDWRCWPSGKADDPGRNGMRWAF